MGLGFSADGQFIVWLLNPSDCSKIALLFPQTVSAQYAQQQQADNPYFNFLRCSASLHKSLYFAFR